MHLIIEGRDGNAEKLADLTAVYDLLDSFPDEIGMTKITPPIVRRYVGTKPEDWGISGFVMIAESHISVHTFPEKREVSIDVFSCKEFDGVEALNLMCRAFDLQDHECVVLRRGLEYSRDIRMLPDSLEDATVASPNGHATAVA
jgi:S-adenosylmethionine decarboxylase